MWRRELCKNKEDLKILTMAKQNLMNLKKKKRQNSDTAPELEIKQKIYSI